MKKFKLLFAIILALLNCNASNTDSSTSKNEFSISNTLKTRDVYVGTYDNQRANVLLNTELKYWFKFGLFFSVATDLIIAGKKGSSLSDIGFTAGYDQYFLKDDVLNIMASYSYYWQNSPSNAKVIQRIRNLQNHDLNFYAYLENDILNTSLNFELLSGTITDIIITPEISHSIYLIDREDQDALYIQPFISTNIGTANNLLVYGNNGISPNDYFSFLNMELGLRINYEIAFFEIEPFFSYSHALRDFNSTFIKNKDIIWGGGMIKFTF